MRLKVTGGSAGTDIAQFIRAVGANASVNRHASGRDPQVQFVSAGNTLCTLAYRVIPWKVQTTLRLELTLVFIDYRKAGNVGIGTTAPYYKLDTRFSDTTTALSGGTAAIGVVTA